MSTEKKMIRKRFRDSVFERDNHLCVMCGALAIDAHHITNRNDMPNGGYVKENGISLCAECHLKAENEEEGFEPEILYDKIDSSKESAIYASRRLR